MGRFVAQRLLQMVIVLWVVATTTFLVLHLIGDPIQVLMPELATFEQREAMRRTLGLDRPLWVQYGAFLMSALRGDLGVSYYHNQPAQRLVLERLPASLELVTAALALAIVVSIPLGILAARARGSRFDRGVLIGSLIGISAPPFWVGIMLIYIFSVHFRWLPSFGRGTLAHLILPALSLSFYRMALFVRLVRAGMFDIMGQDYIRTARAKGLSEWVVTFKHALKNILIPVVTLAGLEMGHLMAGAVVTERIFAWPGMSRLLLDAIYKLDFPIIIATALLIAVLFVVINFVVDILYAFLDPRIRYV